MSIKCGIWLQLTPTQRMDLLLAAQQRNQIQRGA